MSTPPDLPTVTLAKGREGAILRRSPWVFSGAVADEPAGIEDGDLVRVVTKNGSMLGTGHYQVGSIRVRMLYFGGAEMPAGHLKNLLSAAIDLRRRLGLADDPLTNAYRLVHAAGDGLPGLIVDRYADVAVVQCHSIGMHRQREAIARWLRELLPEQLVCVYDKSQATLPDRYAHQLTDGTLIGTDRREVTISENGRRFHVAIAEGQKTGFFLDQRENRWLLGGYANGKRVLNLFSYTGGFSIYALAGGAEHVVSVDLSDKATQLARENGERNGYDRSRHEVIAADVMEYLKSTDPASFDLVVVDPPAYAKNKHRRHKAVQAYKRLNARAIATLRPGGLLFTFSCSRVVERQLFYDTVVAAGLEVGRSARVLHRLAQGPDHPVSLFHPEGEYLKGLVVQFD